VETKATRFQIGHIRMKARSVQIAHGFKGVPALPGQERSKDALPLAQNRLRRLCRIATMLAWGWI
jgi:hypothetical protein